jgi:phospholipase C
VCLAATAAAALAAPAASARPIQHFIVLMQENHSFDNYFGTYPGADGPPADACLPTGARRRPCVRPFHLGGRAVPDVGHDRRMHRLQFARGGMDGFVRATSVDRQAPEPSVMGWYDERDMPFYWNVAREYVLFDRFFASAADGSEANHNYWVRGRPDASGPTVFHRLEDRGISWKFYVEDLGPNTQGVRVPLLGTPLASRVADLEEYYQDLAHSRLPQVAYIAPGGASEHPPGRIQAGEALVRRLLTALWKSDAWERSAFMWTYDNWGGWFDHVRPPRGRGFRVPALLVSPYARRGHVDSTVLETASIPRFIEDNWDLEPLGARDRDANGLAQAFDFSQSPREPAIVSAAIGQGEEPEPRRWAIYLAYGGAAIVGAVLFGWILIRPASRVRTLAACLAVALVPLGAAAAPEARAAVPPVIQTVPEVPGMRFALGGIEFEADGDGRAYPPLAAASSSASLRVLPTVVAPGTGRASSTCTAAGSTRGR